MSEKTARHYSFFPLLWPAAAFAVGIVLQAEFDIGPWQSASVCLIAGAAALALSPRTAATVALLVCFTAAGALTLRTAVRSVNAPAAVKQTKRATVAAVRGERASAAAPAIRHTDADCHGPISNSACRTIPTANAAAGHKSGKNE